MKTIHIPGFTSFSELLIKTYTSPKTLNLVLIVQTLSGKVFGEFNIKG